MSISYLLSPSKDIVISISLEKTWLGNHPRVSVEVNYKGAKLYSDERTYSTDFSSFNNPRRIIWFANEALRKVFLDYPFVYDEFPGSLSYEEQNLYYDKVYTYFPFAVGDTILIKNLVALNFIKDMSRGAYWVDSSMRGCVLVSDDAFFRTRINGVDLFDLYGTPVCARLTKSFSFFGEKLVGKRFKVLSIANGIVDMEKL